MIYLANDHNGVEKMKYICSWLDKNGYEYEWVGAKTYDKSDSYVTYVKMANEVVKQKGNFGIYMCGTGLGASIAANRCKGIRAVLCNYPESAYYGRFHNDANVMAISAGMPNYPKVSKRTLNKMLHNFLTTEFEGGRHVQRVKDLDEMY